MHVATYMIWQYIVHGLTGHLYRTDWYQTPRYTLHVSRQYYTTCIWPHWYHSWSKVFPFKAGNFSERDRNNFGGVSVPPYKTEIIVILKQWTRHIRFLVFRLNIILVLFAVLAFILFIFKTQILYSLAALPLPYNNHIIVCWYSLAVNIKGHWLLDYLDTNLLTSILVFLDQQAEICYFWTINLWRNCIIFAVSHFHAMFSIFANVCFLIAIFEEVFELQRQKTYFGNMYGWRIKSACTFTELVKVLFVRRRKLCIFGYPNASTEDSDQTARMRRLIWIFAGRTWPKVRFLTSRLI